MKSLSAGSRRRKRRASIAIGLVYIALALVAAGCGSSSSDGDPEAIEISEVVVPPVVCSSEPTLLRIFASYTTSVCDTPGCLAPTCGTSLPCPDSAECVDGQCKAAACTTADDPVCKGDTHCNTETHRCEYMTCADDSTCPCGTYCDTTTGRCRMNCLGGPDSGSTGLACPNGLVCDGRGQCSPLNGNTLPAQEVTLAVDQSLLHVVPDDSGNFPTLNLTLTVSTKSQATGALPPPVIRAVPHTDLQVACDATSNLDDEECEIDGASWVFVPQTTPQGVVYVASRALRVKVATSSAADSWLLDLVTEDATQQLAVHVERSEVQVNGRYSGTIKLGNGNPVTSLAIRATVTDGAVVLHDPARMISATGTVLLPASGAIQAASYLGDRRDGKLYNKHTAQYRLVDKTTTFDPNLGRLLTGTAAVKLASSSDREEIWTFQLTRIDDLHGAPCPQGEFFDSAQGTCLIGAPWDGAAFATPAVTHDQATRWSNAIASLTRDPLLTSTASASVVERLLCLDKTSLGSNIGLQDATSPVSGDLVCSGSSGGHGWWGVGLVSLRDRSPSSTTEQFDFLSDCLDQIGREPGLTTSLASIDNDSCVSPARFYPALLGAAGGGPYRSTDPLSGSAADDRRNRGLMTRMLQQWAALTGFIANNGAAQRNAGDMLAVTKQFTPLTGDDARLDQRTTFSYESLLDTVDKAWTLVLDQRVLEPLRAMPAAELAAPDYRMLHRPDSYWTFDPSTRSGATVNSITGGPALTASPGSLYEPGENGVTWTASPHQVNLTGLDRDLTVALRVRHANAWSGSSVVFDSDGLVIREDSAFDGAIPTLFVGHRIADGTVQGTTFKLIIPDGTSWAGESVFVRRDARAKVYLVSGANMSITEDSLRASYTSPPAVASSTTVIGGPRAAGAMKGWVNQVAVWRYMLSETDVRLLHARYLGQRPAWPADVALPDPADKTANEAAVGLPALWLESLIPTMRLIEAYLKDASLDNVATCRQGFVDDRVRRAEERAGRSLRFAYAIQQLAQSLHDRAASAGSLAWATRYDQALAELTGARSKALDALSNAEACQNPIGMGRNQFPLYFATADTSVPANLMEASALFLQNLAGSSTKVGTAIADAANQLEAARVAWRNQYTSTVQDVIAANDDARRLDAIRAGFGRDLVDLCGIPGEDSIAVLRRFTDAGNPNPLAPASCYIQDTGFCGGSELRPLGSIAPSCFRGQVGEAWLAAQSASQRVARARAAWQAAIKASDLWNRHCVEQEMRNDGARDASADLAALQAAEAQQDAIMDFAHGVGMAAAGIVLTVVTEGGGAPAGIPLILAGGERIADSTDKILLGTDRRSALEQLLRDRSLDQADADCRQQAAIAALPLDGAEKDISIAITDLQAALVRAATLQNRVKATVIEAQAAVAREQQLTRPRLAFHYWADEALELFKRRMARARRITYLYLRAVEHDLQRSYGLDAAVLNAMHPEQLNGVATTLGNELNQGMEQRQPGPVVKVISLCKDVLHLPELNDETNCDGPKSQQQFRDILFSPANAMYEGGLYFGQRIPFRLTPDVASVAGQCAERISAVDAQIVGSYPGGELIDLKLDKRETFYSTTCRDHVDIIGPIQEGTLRTSSNLFVEGQISAFSQDREFTRAGLQALEDMADEDFATRGSPGDHASFQLAGRGLYGDYAFIVPAAAVAKFIDASAVHDFRIRFDFVAIENNGDAVNPSTRQLAVELRDGDGKVITGATGNAVSASCASCDLGTTATLTATPAAGWHFGGWTGACVGSAATCSVTIDAPHRAWATFVDDRAFSAAAFTFPGSGSGKIGNGWMAPDASSLTGADKAIVHLVAQPDPGSYFLGWFGGGCLGTGTCDLTIGTGTPPTVFANFGKKATLTVNVLTPGGDAWQAGGAGTLTGMATRCFESQCTFSFLPSTPLTLFAGNPNWGVLSWGGSCSGNTTCPLVMNSDLTVTANLRPRVFVATDPLPPNGFVVFPLGGTSTLSCGLSQQGPTFCGAFYLVDTTVTLRADDASALHPFLHWTRDASSCGSNRNCSLVIRPNMHVSALFQ